MTDIETYLELRYINWTSKPVGSDNLRVTGPKIILFDLIRSLIYGSYKYLDLRKSHSPTFLDRSLTDNEH